MPGTVAVLIRTAVPLFGRGGAGGLTGLLGL